MTRRMKVWRPDAKIVRDYLHALAEEGASYTLRSLVTKVQQSGHYHLMYLVHLKTQGWIEAKLIEGQKRIWLLPRGRAALPQFERFLLSMYGQPLLSRLPPPGEFAPPGDDLLSKEPRELEEMLFGE